MMRNFIFYAIAGSVFWYISQSLGAGLGVSMFASLILPPLLLVAFMIYKNR
jgi:hypothetical protein